MEIKTKGRVAMKWEVRGTNINGEKAVLSFGESEASFPSARMRKVLRGDGHKVYVDGKIYKEPETAKK